MVKTVTRKIESFMPECLTINLGSDCNLACRYCFAKKKSISETGNGTLDKGLFTRVVRAAAHLVAANSRMKRMKFFFGFQGDGEPLMQFELLQDIHNVCSEVCVEYELEYFSFITSNGTMEEYKYRWLAKNFERVCISVDGPSFIHDAQRHFPDGKPTLDRIAHSLDILRMEGCNPVCRATVTPENSINIPDIVHFLCENLKFRHLQLEPRYYLNNQKEIDFPAELFTDNIIAARTIARGFGSEVAYSGYRKAEKHGPYCNLLKNVLYITPEGKATACAFGIPPHEYLEIGMYDPQEDRLVLDNARIDSIYENLAICPEDCMDCPIIDHCIRGCPDFCLLKGNINREDAGCSRLIDSPRCRINHLLYEKGW